jgi:hypothetical protein
MNMPTPLPRFQSVDVRNVRMIQRGERLRFASEARHALRVVRKRLRQDLDRDIPIELRVARAIHLAHTAGADRAGDLVRADSAPWLHQKLTVLFTAATQILPRRAGGGSKFLQRTVVHSAILRLFPSSTRRHAARYAGVE